MYDTKRSNEEDKYLLPHRLMPPTRVNFFSEIETELDESINMVDEYSYH